MISLGIIEWGLAMALSDFWLRFLLFFRLKIAIWFDPDRDFRSVDKMLHAFGGFAVALILLYLVHTGAIMFAHTGLGIILATLAIGLVWELGQTDTAHSQHLLGKPGYGIGLVDLFYDGLGALVLLLFRFTLRLL